MESIFQQVGFIIMGATLAGFLARYANQPLIPAYLLAGVLLGPVFGLIPNSGIITGLSEIGVVFLLFLVGLEIDLSKLKPILNIAVIGGFIQIFFMGVFGYFVAGALGFNNIESLYAGLIIAMSSTMVVVKMLSERKELDTVHGRITIGILILQDIVAIAALMLLQSAEGLSSSPWALLTLKVTLAFSVTLLVMKFLSAPLFSLAAPVQELVFFIALSICFFFALLFQWEGFSLSIGAFIGGVTLANSPYQLEIATKIRALRDFFAAVFFVSLGLQIVPVSTGWIIYPLLIFILLTVVLKPIITLGICSAFGYSKRPAFLSSVSLAQVSEFSLILAAQGLAAGQLSEDFFTLTVLLTIITLTLAAYLLRFESSIYKVSLPLLAVLEKCHLAQPPFMMLPKTKKWDIILCGFHRMGHNVYHGINAKKVVVVDYDPDILLCAAEEKIPFIYGDATDSEVLRHAGVKHARILISSIPDTTANMTILAIARKLNKKIQIIVTAQQYKDAFGLYEAGAAFVILPHLLGGKYTRKLVTTFFTSPEILKKEKELQLRELNGTQ